MSILHRNASRSTRVATIRATPATFAAGIMPAESLDDSWGDRFNAAQRRFRESIRPVAVVEVAPVTAAEAVQCIGLDKAESWSLNAAANEARYLAAVQAAKDGETLEVSTDREEVARKAARLAAATKIVTEAPRCDWPRSEGEPASWGPETDAHIWNPTDDESFADQLLEAIAFHGENGPARRRADPAELSSAWYNGFKLGESGFEVDEVCPPQHYSADEANSFISGLEVGSAERWAEYGRDIDELDRERTMEALYADPFLNVEEHEYAEARMSVAVVA